VRRLGARLEVARAEHTLSQAATKDSLESTRAELEEAMITITNLEGEAAVREAHLRVITDQYTKYQGRMEALLGRTVAAYVGYRNAAVADLKRTKDEYTKLQTATEASLQQTIREAAEDKAAVEELLREARDDLMLSKNHAATWQLQAEGLRDALKGSRRESGPSPPLLQ